MNRIRFLFRTAPKVARPIIMGVRGEAREIVMEAGAVIAMEPDSPESLLAAVEQLADNPELTLGLGYSARQYVAEHYNRGLLAARYLTLLHQIAGVEPALEPAPASAESRPASPAPHARLPQNAG